MSPPDRDQPSPEIPPTKGSGELSPSDTLSTQGLASGPADAAPPAPGPAGMRYRVLRPHAEGGLGEVLVAHDEELDREVALKQLHPQFADQARNRERFVREARLTGLLEHPGVVPIYGLGTYPDGRPFYAMRLIKGDSLREAIERHHADPAAARRPLDLRLLLARFVGVCNAVAYAHSKGIIHRDLKPDNVMLGEFGETLVVDWGLAKQLASGGAHSSPSPSTGEDRDEADSCHPHLPPQRAEGEVRSLGSELTAAGGVLGTPAYMSPEQAAGKVDELGPASDVYSLGATLYHLLVGKAPFDGRAMVDVLDRVRRGAFVPPRRMGVPVVPPLEAVCLKAMARLPADRYGSARALADDVERWLADEPVDAFREPWPMRLARWCRRHPALVTGLLALVFTGLVAAGIGGSIVAREQERTRRSERDRIEAQVDALLHANPDSVPRLVDQLSANRQEALPYLRRVREKGVDPNETASSRAVRRQRQARAALALLPDDPSHADLLVERMLAEDTEPDERLLIRSALAPYAARLVPSLWAEAEKPQPSLRRFRALVALALFDPHSSRWRKAAAAAAEGVVSVDPRILPTAARALEPVREVLLEPLGRWYRDRKQPAARYAAAVVLAEHAAGRLDLLVDLLCDADEPQFLVLLPRLRELGRPALDRLERELAPANLAWRRANAGAALLLLGRPGPAWPLFRHTDRPDARTHLVHRAGPLGVDARLLAQRLAAETDVSARRALVLALGEYDTGQLPAPMQREWTDRLLGWYRDDPDPGLHAAIDWLLGHGREGPVARRHDWGVADALARVDQELRGKPAGRRWYVNGQGQTMVRIEAGEFVMGSPPTEDDRDEDEKAHPCRLASNFALSAREVSVAQFRRFRDAHPQIDFRDAHRFSPAGDGPAVAVSWYEAAQYCRWLSEQEGIAPDQMCYPSVAEIEKCKRGDLPLRLPPDFLKRTGYRLPTEAEWEYACRAGSRGRYYFGDGDHLDRYGFDVLNAEEHAWPCGQKKPNDLGLFDMGGNASEWCQDRYGPYSAAEAGKLEVLENQNRVLRGGGYDERPATLRSAARSEDRPSQRWTSVGLRIARTQR